MPSCARRSARSVAAIRASSSRRSSGCSRSQAMTSCSASRYSRSLSSATGTTTWRLAGKLGQHLGLQAAHEAAPAQVPVQTLLGELAAELAGEARARAEVLQAPDHAQLADQLLGVVEHRRAGQREPQAVGDHGLRQPPHRVRALGLRVLAQCDSSTMSARGRSAAERLAVGGDDLVVEDRDLGRRRHRHPPLDDRHRAMRQPFGGLALPVELQRGGADDDGREGVVGLERGERLARSCPGPARRR